MLSASEHRDAARHAVHADHRQVEFADHHGQPKPQRHQADGREDLERAVGGRRAEKRSLAGIERSEQEDAGREDGERPPMWTGKLAPRVHRSLPRACSTMTASTISPAARYCHSWRSPFTTTLTYTPSMTITPPH